MQETIKNIKKKTTLYGAPTGQPFLPETNPGVDKRSIVSGRIVVRFDRGGRKPAPYQTNTFASVDKARDQSGYGFNKFHEFKIGLTDDRLNDK